MSDYYERPGENKRQGEYRQQGEYKQPVRTHPPKKNDSDIGSWIFIALMFAVAWPVGLFFLIGKLSDGSRKRTAAPGKAAAPAAKTARPTAERKPLQQMSAVTKTPQYSAKGAQTMKTVGILLAIFGAAAILGVLSNAGFNIQYGYWWDLLEELFFPVGLLSGGVAVWLGGCGMTKRNRRFGKYLAVAGDREAVPIAWLARAAEVSVRKAEKDLELMVEKGLWGAEAYVDIGSGMVFRSQAAAAAYFNARSQPSPAPEQAEQGYSGMLRQIRRANDRIADPVLSAKIDRLEEVAGKIFRLIEKEPAKKEKASTFLNYYLPTTQKLLDAYAEFEEAGVSGDNLTQAKEKIEQTMSNVVAGFERQLDELYRTDALDIDSDIRVMETMLRRDSSSAAADFGLGGCAAQQDDIPE